MTAFACRRYQLARARSVPVVLPASAYGVPLATPADYARITLVQPDERAPVLLDHAQYFRFLSDLAATAWHVLGEDTRLFIELRAPYIYALPARLLDERVLLGTRLGGEMAFWATHRAGPLAWIQDRIRRDLDYPGDNTLSVASPSAQWLDALDVAVATTWPAHALRLARADAD